MFGAWMGFVFLHDRPDLINHYDGVTGFTKECRFILMPKLGILSTFIGNSCTLLGLALYDTIIDGTLEEAGLLVKLAYIESNGMNKLSLF